MAQGLASSTHRTYKSAQLRFVNFCSQAGRLHPNGSPCPASEWTLCLFATHLSSSLCSSSIKIYLSAVRSMHIDLGLPDPLVDCLQLQRVLRGIKRTRGSTGFSRLPITDHHMLIIYKSLCLSNHDHLMFCAASTLAYFGFLRSSEFTVSSLSAFNPLVHLSISDIAVDSHVSPSCLQLNIKASKTDPFSEGLLPLHWHGSSSALCVICPHTVFTSPRPVTWSFVSPFIWPTSLSCPFDTLA